MPPSLEAYDEVVDHLPVKPVATKMNRVPVVSSLQLEDDQKHDFVLRYFRAYIADLCEQFKGGHPGYVKLARRLTPLTDSMQVSNGHGCHWHCAVPLCHEVFSKEL